MSTVVVLKYPVAPTNPPAAVTILMPAGATIVHVGQQHDTPTLWVKDERTRAAYLGTTELHDGAILAHLFELVER